jgi:hypothetical protein
MNLFHFSILQKNSFMFNILYPVVIHEHKLDFTFGDNCVGDHCLAPAMSGFGVAFDGFGGKEDLVSGDDGLSQFDAIHTEKDGELSRVLKPLGKQQPGELGHRFDN